VADQSSCLSSSATSGSKSPQPVAVLVLMGVLMAAGVATLWNSGGALPDAVAGLRAGLQAHAAGEDPVYVGFLLVPSFLILALQLARMVTAGFLMRGSVNACALLAVSMVPDLIWSALTLLHDRSLGMHPLLSDITVLVGYLLCLECATLRLRYLKRDHDTPTQNSGPSLQEEGCVAQSPDGQPAV